MTKASLTFTVAVAAFATAGATAFAQEQTKGQQGCINALNKAGAKLAAAQGKEAAGCVKNAGKGKEPDAQACLTADPKEKVLKASGKVGAAETKKCVEDPDFGRAAVGQITNAAVGQDLALTEDVFGSDLTAAIIDAGVDKTGAGCQAAVTKAYEKLAAAKIKSFLKCKKDGLKGKSGTPFSSAADLEGCITAIASDAKVDKAIDKLVKTIGTKCPTPDVDTDTAFPGDCVGVTFEACLDELVECRVCLMLDAMDNLELDCDLFDNGVSDTSCAMLPTTTSTTTTSTTTTTIFTPDWGLGCFPSMDCGATFCPANLLQCTDFVESVGLATGDEPCFFDCMDGTGFGAFMDVLDCRDGCGGGPAPPCAAGPDGGFTGVVTGPGACTASGFATSFVTFGLTASELKRVLVEYTTTIDETALFGGTPPACDASCPGTSSACDIGAPHAATPSPGLFRIQIGTPTAAPEICDRAGVPTTVCKFSPSGYAFVLDLPPSPGGIDLTGAPIDVTVFMSCAIESSGGGSFLHFSTGDYFATATF